MKAHMREVIAELERATEGSRELDDMVRRAVGTGYTDNSEYTTSLDAAMMLVPSNTGVSLFKIDDWNATITVGRGHFANYHNGWATTPAIALCIACLKARAATGNEGGNDPRR